MSASLPPYLYGALTMGCFVIGLKFLKFWTLSRDRFFLWFAAAFWVFAVGWCLRAVLPMSADHAYYGYLPRLGAFLLILIAIIDKNRRGTGT